MVEPRPHQIRRLVEEAIPDSTVAVHDLGGGDHLQVEVTSPAFAGKPLLAQHRMVMAALKEELAERVHAVRIVTRPAAGAKDDTGGTSR